MLIAHTIPGIVVYNQTEAFLLALLTGILSTVLRPILAILTIPITVLTLGVSLLVIDICIFWLAISLSFGVQVNSFLGIIYGGIILWVLSILTSRFIWSRK